MLSLTKEHAQTNGRQFPRQVWASQSLSAQMAASTRPEAQLLFACARTIVDSDIAKSIKLLLMEDLDWDFVFEKAQQNCVMPLVCWNLLNGCAELVPETILHQLREFFSAHARHNLFQTAELIKLQRLFEANGITALPFKGPTLAISAYGNLSLRQFSDLDILVQRRDLLKVINLLVAQGYKLEGSQKFSSLSIAGRRRKDLVLMSEDARIRIEIHWRLSGTHFSFPLNLENLWKASDTLPLAGTMLRCLSPQESLLYLSLHGSRHGWERLGWISDIAELIRRHPELDWSSVIAQAQLLGCERALMLALFLAVDLLDATVPTPVRQRFEDDSELKFIASNVREWLFRQPGDSLKLSDWYFYHLGMKERPRDRARLHLHYYLRYLHLALTPNQKDHTLVMLPASFSFLYYLLRPLRLANECLLAPLKRLFRHG